MSEFNVLELIDEAIVSVRDTESHTVQYGEDGCDGEDIGVLYGEIECATHEVAAVIQAEFDKQAADIKLLREAISNFIAVDEEFFEEDKAFQDAITEMATALTVTNPDKA